METWRLIVDNKENGSWNMAVDEALLESSAAKLSLPTLRLYDWNPYTLSLGYAQPFSDVNLEALNERQWGLVRRPTGGKAILHADELTYSVTAPEDNKILSGSVIESYQRLSKALLHSLKEIGINADSEPKNKKITPSQISPVCFQHPSDYEITFNGKKLIGSAQARRKGGVLQHGAIPLFGCICRIIDVLSFSSDVEKERVRQSLLRRAATIEDVLSKKITWLDMASAVRIGFEQSLNICFFEGYLTDFEINRAREIEHEKYANNQWTKRI